VYAGFQAPIGRILTPGPWDQVQVYLDMRVGYAHVIYAQTPQGLRSQEIPVWIFWTADGRMRYMKGAKFWVLFDDYGYTVGTNQSVRKHRRDPNSAFCVVPDLLNLKISPKLNAWPLNPAGRYSQPNLPEGPQSLPLPP